MLLDYAGAPAIPAGHAVESTVFCLHRVHFPATLRARLSGALPAKLAYISAVYDSDNNDDEPQYRLLPALVAAQQIGRGPRYRENQLMPAFAAQRGSAMIASPADRRLC